jgi:oxazoline/thiazoline dehydrogenase
MSDNADLRISFNDDVSLVDLPGGERQLKYKAFDHVFHAPTSLMVATLDKIANGGANESELLALVADDPDGSGFMAHLELMFLLTTACVLRYTVWDGGRAIAELRWLNTGRPLDPARARPGEAYRLSRFACLRRLGERLIVECPLGRAQIHLLTGSAVSAVAALAEPKTAEGLADDVEALSPDGALHLLNLLCYAEAASPTDEEGKIPAEESAPLGWWEYHDLLFHSRTRLGRHGNPYGGTFVRRGVAEPPPLVRAETGEPVRLHKPDLDRLKAADEPFTAVVERRRSVRNYADRPISVDQLGELLYRAARIQRVIPTGPGDMQYSYRPAPGGGAIHELEICPVVARCEGLSPGVYRYNALEHHLTAIAGSTPEVERLLEQAWITGDKKSKPQVILAIVARFGRIQWKYESVVYSTILKNVGALYATMYLVATAMGLAPCALGGGNSDLFAEAAGLEYLASTTVGEFMLGSREK